MNKKFIELSQKKISQLKNEFCKNHYLQFHPKTKVCEKSLNEKNFNKKTLILIFSIWVFTIGFYLALFSGIVNLSDKLNAKINMPKEKEYSLYKPGIAIIDTLKGTNYLKYIQRLYIHPKEKNKMMIMIKPNYWGAITQDEKNEIITKVVGEWQKIYKNSNYDKTLKPEAYFANI